MRISSTLIPHNSLLSMTAASRFSNKDGTQSHDSSSLSSSSSESGPYQISISMMMDSSEEDGFATVKSRSQIAATVCVLRLMERRKDNELRSTFSSVAVATNQLSKFERQRTNCTQTIDYILVIFSAQAEVSQCRVTLLQERVKSSDASPSGVR